MKRYRIRLGEGAERDLVDLHRYISLHESVQRAEYVLDRLEALCAELVELPERGHVPPELHQIGVTSYREVHFKPYRVIYEVTGRDVSVHCILDERRDMQSLLQWRLIR